MPVVAPKKTTAKTTMNVVTTKKRETEEVFIDACKDGEECSTASRGQDRQHDIVGEEREDRVAQDGYDHRDEGQVDQGDGEDQGEHEEEGDEEQEEEEEIESEQDDDRQYRSPPDTRTTTVVSSNMPGSPRAKVVSRVAVKRSPRLGTIKSPKAALAATRKPSLYKRYKELREDDLIFDEDDILDVELQAYENLRTPDVLTWLKAVNAYPYFYQDNGTVTNYGEGIMCYPVETQQDVDDAFEFFECRRGILAFSPMEDVDFGEDDDATIPTSRYDDYYAIVPVLSSGEAGKSIRFIQEFAFWGLIPREEYHKYAEEEDELEAKSKESGGEFVSKFRERIGTAKLRDPADVELDYEDAEDFDE